MNMEAPPPQGRSRWRIGLVLALVLAAAAVAVLGFGDRLGLRAPAGPVLRPDDAQVTALGERIYRSHCAVCHGARLEGQPDWRQRDAQGRLPAPPHDASGHTWHHPDEVLFRITKLGVAQAAGLSSYDSAMPAYEGVLTDAEMIAVLSWIKAQWPAEIRAKHDAINRGTRAAR
jgi:mono/diheme cytochrome c family protein